MPKKIATTSDLREFLCDSIEKLQNDQLDTEKARNISRLAAQINENLNTEVKVLKHQIERGESASSFGKLQLAG